MKPEKHTAVYVRVSSAQQKTDSQVPELVRWCQAHVEGAPPDAERIAAWCDGNGNGTASPTLDLGSRLVWYRDKYTGRTMDRPGMNTLQQNLRAGKAARLVVWRLDRLGRTTKGVCELFDELTDRKIDLVSLRDGFSLDSPGGRMIARIMASVAEYETEVRAERVLAGQVAARAKGRRWGGSKPGRYTKVSPDQVNAITEMIGRGERVSTVARITGLSRPTIYRVLRNEAKLK